MARQFRRLGIDLLATGGTDIRVRVSAGDSTSGFLNEKLTVDTSNRLSKFIENVGGNESLRLDVVEANVNHDALMNFDVDEHRPLDDAQTTTTNLWSADKIQSDLNDKMNVLPGGVANNRLLKSDSSNTDDLAVTGITVDASNNVTGINDLTVTGDLTVNGTTTSVNTDTLDVEDANITVNKGGTQASANLADAGLTVEMSDATDAVLGYDSTLTSQWKLGASGALSEAATVSHTQTLTNKTIDADNNTISELEVDNLKSGVLDTDLTNVSASDDTIPSARAVVNYIQNNVLASGDIIHSEFTGANNVGTFTDITNFAFTTTSRSFDALVSVSVQAASGDLYEEFNITGIRKNTSWDISIDSIGDNSQVNFTITSSGQMQYTSGNYTGFTNLEIAFRARTTLA